MTPRLNTFFKLSIFAILGCYFTLDGSELEQGCFPSFDRTIGGFLSAQNREMFVWDLGNEWDSDFLREHGVIGLLLSLESPYLDEQAPLADDVILVFTGDVYKSVPNFFRRHIFGMQKKNGVRGS